VTPTVAAAVAAITPEATRRLGSPAAEVFLARAARRLPDAVAPLEHLFGARRSLPDLLAELLGRVLDAAADRSAELRLLDHRREIEPDWFQQPGMLGYSAYTHRFGGTFAGVAEHLDHLVDLGVTYLHLMPLLHPRPGENDGGYAVMDYRSTDPRLGTMAELEQLAGRLRAAGISLCVDVVCNHTAYEHEWAQKARAGNPRYRAYYHVFADRTLPDAYERTLREVFPAFAPGNFTWDDDLHAWVWTTFNAFQWDLDHSNPDVFAELLEIMLFLANRGVEVLRLDAVPFLWKRLGTGCENQPEAHLLLQAWRALVSIAAPAVLFKAEAIVAPDVLVPYLGAHEDAYHPECDLAYNNQLMVQLWSGLASQDARLATRSLERVAHIPPDTSWCTYLRCHDDIGWAIFDEDAAWRGWDGPSHRRFLTDFYAGRFPGTYARGLDFQFNPDTGDVRTSGAAASLCGLDAARRAGDAAGIERAIRRLVLAYSVLMSFGGIPLIWMGDEVALPNDTGYLADPALAADNRWAHRPPMDWDAVARAADPHTVEGRVLGWFRRLAQARQSIPALHAGGAVTPWWSHADPVLCYHRRHPRSGPLLAFANLSEHDEAVPLDLLHRAGLGAEHVVLHGDQEPFLAGSVVVIPALGFVWYAA
jgi:amylosucrase